MGPGTWSDTPLSQRSQEQETDTPMPDRSTERSPPVKATTETTGVGHEFTYETIVEDGQTFQTPQEQEFIELQRQVAELESLGQKEKDQREQVETQLRLMTGKAEDMRRRWKLTARELNEIRLSGQGFYTVTDEYLIELATRLRFNIRNFSLQYFEGDGSARFGRNTNYFKRFIEPVKDYKVYLNSRDKFPSLIQMLLWKVVVSDIFGTFRWAGEAATATRKLAEVLRPVAQKKDGSKVRDLESERKFQRWRASTAELLAAVVEADHPRDQDAVLKAKCKIFDEIRDVLPLLSGSRKIDGVSELSRIIDEAISMDKEISRILAQVDWVFSTEDAEKMLDSKTVELDKDEKPLDTDGVDQLVVEPAMVKWGKSTGEDYGTKLVLLPLEVSLAPVDEGASKKTGSFLSATKQPEAKASWRR